ncbi:MAG: glutamine synthetase type III, partial [Akkermansia sp.]|nr:glutamine synthetase type III [Akkermansia sp.]
IEAKTCLNMLQTIYLPAVAAQMTQICGTIAAIKAAGLTVGLKAAIAKAESVGALYDELPDKVAALEEAIASGKPTDMCAAMEAARVTVDALEAIVDADLWPVPTYAQMLNIHSK